MTRLAIYAPGRAALRAWARAHLVSDHVVVERSAEVQAQPPDASWICVAEDEPALRALVPAAIVRVVAPAEHTPWAALAHDLRGPAGVLSGALQELESDDPMLTLARRATAQLIHTAQCWEVLGGEAPEGRSADIAVVLEQAHREFGELEPRRKDRLQLRPGGFEGQTDPTRLRLGLVRLFSYLVRASREPITARAHAPDRVVIEGKCGPGSLRLDRPPWSESPRLGLAVALLGPLLTEWSVEQATTQLVLARLDPRA